MMDEARIIAKLIDDGHLAPKQVERAREKAGNGSLRDTLIAADLITAADWDAAAAAAAPAQNVEELLAAVPSFDDLLSDLTMVDIKAFSTILGSETYTTGKALFREGDEGSKLYVLKSGSVHIYKGGTDIATLRTGDVLGEMSFILGWQRTGRAVADGETELLVIDRKEFLKFCGRAPVTGLKIVLGLIKVICYRLQAYELALAHAAGRTPPLLRYDPDQGLTFNEVYDLLDADQAADLRTISREQTVPAGEPVFAQGDGGDDLYAVTRGTVDIVYTAPGGARQTVARLGEGYVFGEVAFVLGWPRTAAAVASETATLTVIDKAGFGRFMAAHPGAALRIIITLARLISFRLETYTSATREKV